MPVTHDMLSPAQQAYNELCNRHLFAVMADEGEIDRARQGLPPLAHSDLIPEEVRKQAIADARQRLLDSQAANSAIKDEERLRARTAKIERIIADFQAKHGLDDVAYELLVS